MQQLSSLPAPTYVVGIDDIAEQGYIMCAKVAQIKGIYGLNTAYPLTEQNQDILWAEVKAYWERLAELPVNSHFVDQDRK